MASRVAAVVAGVLSLCVPVGVNAQVTGSVGGASPTARAVSSGLSGDRTDLQRDAFWDTVRRKEVRWTLEVSEVTTGWFSGLKVRGMATPTLQVSCELEDTPAMKSAVQDINKGDHVVCSGKLGRTFVVMFGMATIMIEGVVQRP